MGNTTTLRYRREVDEILSPVDGSKNKLKKKKEDSVSFKSDNEIIIQPINDHENRGLSIVLNLILGIAIGIAATWFLVIPAKIQKASLEADEKVKIANEQLDLKTADVEEYKSKYERYQEQVINLQEQLNEYEGTDGTLASSYSLIQAVNTYLSTPEEISTIADYLDAINVEDLGDDSSEAPVMLYNTLLDTVGPQLGENFYKTGYSSYNEGDYEIAIENLTRAYQYDQTNGDALYYLAQAYNRSGNENEAIKAYRKVVEEFPGTEKASKSAGYLEQLTGSED